MGSLQSELAAKLPLGALSSDAVPARAVPKPKKAKGKGIRLKKMPQIHKIPASAVQPVPATLVVPEAGETVLPFLDDHDKDIVQLVQIENGTMLEQSDQGIMIQISGHFGSLVRSKCPWLFDSTSETLVDREKRKAAGTKGGTEIIHRTRHVGTLALVTDLAERGWELVDAYAQERESPHHVGSFYCTLRFTFRYHMNIGKEEHAYLAQPQVKRDRRTVTDLLKRLSDYGSWRVRGFRNPLQSPDGTPRFGISLNYENFTKAFEMGPPAQRHLRLVGKKLSIVNP